jgi:predicted transcriptional regulator
MRMAFRRSLSNLIVLEISMASLVAGPLNSVEHDELDEGLALFDDGKFWHAHEAWEALWNRLKQRQAPPEEILLVQGFIQTAALLLHHQRRNEAGVEKQWTKVQSKLEGWSTAWGLDVALHLETIANYAADNGRWTLVAADHQFPRTRG